ncbi:heavy metal translocating P-type ATPase [Absiella sp. AM29-15]|uniref:heavy metal translocating P-type ATPase n=1 Tax=Absiella sp. AM29-15 TaxID=2292278 RepID=UPI000E4172AB|nr:heavy metal translocating P-type ATPase [Absiella sp. AM29-15]RGC52942.1 cadmium-translocating P-type ATPase [Absiella sp. AM29-15]
MEKVYLLENLDCANCAMKIEKKVGKLKGVHEVSVDFVSKKMFIEHEGGMMEEIIHCIHDLEPDVVVKDITKGKKEHHVHLHEEECSCGHEHTHEHHHEEGCGCGHEHTHEHHHEEGCDCGHEHTHEHHHEEGCSCGHEHAAHEERVIAGADKLYINGLDCASCAAKVEAYVQKMDNVHDASLNFSTGVLFVEVEDPSKKMDTFEKIQKVVPTLEDGVVVSFDKQEEKKASMFSFKDNYRLYLGIILFIIAIIFEKQDWSFWLFFASYIIAGGKVVYTALRNIMRGEVFDENFLMSVATIGAFCVGANEEAVAVMIFYEIGEMFQSYAVNRSRKSISSLMNIRADYANLLVNGVEKRVDPQDIKVDDIILVKPGERLPLDGVIINGSSSLDTSALTGESMPREVVSEDEVLAGVVNLNGVITIRVTKEYGESTVSRILELVENASSKKAPMEKFITKFAKVYTPTVVGLAILVVLLPVIFVEGADFNQWLYRALTFLVVSCPCALVISVPLGMFAGIGAASKKGVLIKGGNYLEALKDVDTVVFDKTGTLTKGVFGVSECVPCGMETKQLMEYAAYAEYYSNHPIASSIRKAYAKDIDSDKLSDYEEVAGNGVRVLYEGKELLAGNHKLMDANHIAYEQVKAIGTIIYIAYDHQYAGYVLISDEIKETSKAAIQALKASGVKKCVMLSGDRQEVGEAVAKTLALDEVHMQLLPADKVEKVEMLLEKEADGKKLAFVGDGINDAPVLARADIGVAMGGIGSDAAIEAADVVLMKDDPAALSVAMRIARKTMGILWQNIVFSLVIKIGILILTIFGLSNMWMGVFADVGVTLLAVLNSMRALKVE